MTLETASGVVPSLNASDLIAAAPELDVVARIEAHTFLCQASMELRFSDIARLASLIRSAVARGASGVVVTQGTDTIEETAFQLDLLLDVSAPVVVTGALRSPAQVSADGTANLLHAVRVAAAPAAGGLGVLVVMNEEIHAARFVRKSHTHKVGAFASPTVGPLGWIVEDRVRLVLRPVERLPTLEWVAEPPFVPIITIGLGTDAQLIECVGASEPAGVVIAALGAGHVPSRCLESLTALAARVPVVLASRCGAGEGFRHTYGYSGGEMDLLGRGLISSGALDASKARVLLSLLLGAGADRERIERTFDDAG